MSGTGPARRLSTVAASSGPAAPAGTGASADALMSIGDVLTALRRDFPDVTISKIRFLEEGGLVSPQRTPAGYRKFGPADVRRLQYVLTAQRDHYLPLKVIKANLEALDAGAEPPVRLGSAPAAVGDADGGAPPRVGLTREQLASISGAGPDFVGRLEEYGLLAPRSGSHPYDGDDAIVARTVADLAGFGIGPRHLRGLSGAVDRQVDLISQAVAPMARSGRPGVTAGAADAADELVALAVRLHAALMRSRLADRLSR